MTRFERELESELHRLLDPMTAGQVRPRRVVPRSGAGLKRLVGGAGAALGAKVATGFAMVAVAATAAAAATEVASTGSMSPADWGQHVRQQVTSCKSELAEGQRGIEACISAFSNRHDPATGSPRQASPARAGGHSDEHPGGAAARADDKTEGPGGGSSGDNGNKSHEDTSRKEKDKNPAPGPSPDREPTDPPMVTHIWLPPPPP